MRSLKIANMACSGSRPPMPLRCSLARLLVAAAVTACGGGDDSGDATTSALGVTESDVPDTGKADVSSVAKVAHALTPVTGLFAQALMRDGWSFVPIGPSEAASADLVYVDSSASSAHDSPIIDALRGRKGALVIDSRSTTLGAMVTTTEDGTRAQYVSQLESDPSSGLVPTAELPAENRESDVVRYQFSLGLSAAAAGTAVILQPRETVPVHVLEDGKINNTSERVALEVLDPRHAVKAWAGTPSGRTASALSYSNAHVYNSVALYAANKHYTIAGRLSARAFCEETVRTGQNCRVPMLSASVTTANEDGTTEVVQSGGVSRRAGIYFNAGYPGYIGYTSWGNQEGQANYGPYIQKYGVSLAVRPGYGGCERSSFGAKVASYGPSNLVDPDAREETYSRGFSVGGGFSRAPLPASFSASYSQSRSYSRITNYWKPYVGFNDADSQLWRWSANSLSVKSNPPSGEWWDRDNHSKIDAGWLSDNFDKALGGAPKSTRTGYMPTHVASYRFHENVGCVIVRGTMLLESRLASYKYSRKWHSAQDRVAWNFDLMSNRPVTTYSVHQDIWVAPGREANGYH